MKIRPVILCGGAGTRLWPNKKKHQAKQFIDFGNWTLFGKTLERLWHLSEDRGLHGLLQLQNYIPHDYLI